MGDLREEFRSERPLGEFLPVDSLEAVPEARDYVVDGRRPWRGELLLVVYETSPDATEQTGCAFRAASAIELLAGYVRTRSEFVEGGPGRLGRPDTSRTELILAGDFLKGSAFETLASMDCSDTIVERCFETTTQTVTSVIEEMTTTRTNSSHELTGPFGASSHPAYPSPPSARLGALAADLGILLGRVGPDDSEQLRALGAVLGMAVRSERTHRGDSPSTSHSLRARNPHPGGPRPDRADTYWESAQDIVGRIESTTVRRQLRAFLESLSAGAEL